MKLGDMSVGSVVELSYYDNYQPFRVMHHGKPDASYNDAFLDGTILMLDRSSNGFVIKYREDHPNKCDYPHSIIRRYLQNDVYEGFEPMVKKLVREVRLPYRYGTSGMTVRSGDSGTPNKIWLPSGSECAIDESGAYYIKEGAKFDYWKNKSASEYRYWMLRRGENRYPFRTRTPLKYGMSDSAFLEIQENGVLYEPRDFTGGVRVCMVLPDSTEFDDNLHI